MTLPAHDTFEQDPRINRTLLRVYRHFRETCDVHEIRTRKVASIVLATGIHRSDVIRAVQWLVSNGYVIKHESRPGEAGRYTLAYSVNPTLAQAS